jgi:hypothetical protein
MAALKYHLAGAFQPKEAEWPVAACGRRSPLVMTAAPALRALPAAEQCARCALIAASIVQLRGNRP